MDAQERPAESNQVLGMLSNFRQQMNQTSHMEPTGDETF